MAADRLKLEFNAAKQAVADQAAASAKMTTEFTTLTADLVKLRDTLGKLTNPDDIEKTNTMITTKQAMMTTIEVA